MSHPPRTSSANRRSARISAAPYQIHSYPLDQSTSSEELRPGQPRSLTVGSQGSLGSWELAGSPTIGPVAHDGGAHIAAGAHTHPAVAVSAQGPVAYAPPIQSALEASGGGPQLHLHQNRALDESQANLSLHQHRTYVDESQAFHAHQQNQAQFNNTYNQQLNMAVVTADPEIVNEAWAAVAAARHEEAAVRHQAQE